VLRELLGRNRGVPKNSEQQAGAQLPMERYGEGFVTGTIGMAHPDVAALLPHDLVPEAL
jgi:hypothetical protein